MTNILSLIHGFIHGERIDFQPSKFSELYFKVYLKILSFDFGDTFPDESTEFSYVFSIPKEKSLDRYNERGKEWKDIHNPSFLQALFEFYYCGFAN